jgi:hypothetical protein
MRCPSRALSALLLSLFVFGCAHVKGGVERKSAQSRTRTMDCTIELVFRGEIKDVVHNTPIPYADVVFIDTGFAPRPVEREWSTRVGTSDRTGQIDQRFVYGWYFETTDEALGVEGKEFDFKHNSEAIEYFDLLDKALDKVRAAGTFSIELRKAGYNALRLEFAVRDCAREGDIYIVDLGAVILERDPCRS